jgi:hypothetical protein
MRGIRMLDQPMYCNDEADICGIRLRTSRIAGTISLLAHHKRCP